MGLCKSAHVVPYKFESVLSLSSSEDDEVHVFESKRDIKEVDYTPNSVYASVR